MCFASILFGQGYVVYTQADMLTEQTALYRSNKQQSAEANSFVGHKKQQNITCGAPRFQPAWYQNLGGA